MSHKANPARNYSVIGAFPGKGPRVTCNLTRNPSLIAVPLSCTLQEKVLMLRYQETQHFIAGSKEVGPQVGPKATYKIFHIGSSKANLTHIS